MSGAEGALRASDGKALLARLRGSAGLYRLPLYAACALLALLCSYLLGKEAKWDTLDYHLYSGFIALHDRFAQDYFAAGAGSYFNPYAYAPFYLLVSAGLPALAIASLLALVHGTILWVTYELALCSCPSIERRTCIAVGLWSVALAFLNPVLIEQLGSSYADITTASLALLGWLLLARAIRTPHAWLPLCAGLVLGAATALKLTNAVHAVAAFALIGVMPRPVAAVRCGLYYAGGLALSFTAVAGPWAYQLARHFGNPFFPLLNTVFRSPEFTSAALRHYRFIPENLLEGLWRPFALADPVPVVQVEEIAPDLRYAVLLLLLAFIGMRWLWQRRRVLPAAAMPPESRAATRVLTGLLLGLTIDWMLWLSASGNGRYFLPAACVAAVVLVALAFRISERRPRLRAYLLTAIVALQSFGLYVGADHGASRVPWGGPWFEVRVPARLASEPSLYLTMGAQANSFLAPYLAPGSGLINFAGLYPLSPHGPTGAHIAASVARYAPHVRVLVRGARLYEKEERRDPQRAAVDGALGRFGLRVDPADCATIEVDGMPPDLESIINLGSQPPKRPPRDTIELLSCHVVADGTDHAPEMAGERAADEVFSHLEKACPQLFQPAGLSSAYLGDSHWQRGYFNTDLLAWVSHGEVKFFDALHGDDPVDLGRESDWRRAPLPLVCGRAHGHYFARVLSSR